MIFTSLIEYFGTWDKERKEKDKEKEKAEKMSGSTSAKYIIADQTYQNLLRLIRAFRLC